MWNRLRPVLFFAALLAIAACSELIGLDKFYNAKCTPGEERECPYPGVEGTKGVGACRASKQVCAEDGLSWGECDGTEITPTKEACDNKLDDDCDGVVGNGCACVPGETSACYEGPSGTDGVGTCHGGMHACNADGMTYGACVGEQQPIVEDCSNMLDDDCDSMVNNGCPCTPGAMIACYSGPAGTEGKGTCHAGTHECQSDGATYGPCMNEQVPAAEVCGSGVDSNCDGFLCGETEWANVYEGGFAMAVAVDAVGNIYVAGRFAGTMQVGSTTLIGATTDIFVAKLDRNGAPIWAKQFGGTGSDAALGVAVDETGSVVFSGKLGAPADFGGAAISDQIFVAKLDAAGNYVWATSCGGSSQGVGGTGVAIDAQGDVALVGTFAGTANCGDGAHPSKGGTDILIAKLSGSDGHAIWSKAFGDSTNQTVNGVAVDPTGGILITGGFSGTLNFGGMNLTNKSVYTARFTSSGAHAWSFGWGPSSGAVANAIAVDALGQIVIVGDYFATNADFGGPALPAGTGIFVARYGPTGGVSLGASGFVGTSSNVHAYAVAVDGAGNPVLTGHFRGTIDFGLGPHTSVGTFGDLFVTKLGTPTVWSRMYHGGDTSYADGYGVAVGPGGEIVVAGDVRSTVDFGTGLLGTEFANQFFVMKIAE